MQAKHWEKIFLNYVSKNKTWYLEYIKNSPNSTAKKIKNLITRLAKGISQKSTSKWEITNRRYVQKYFFIREIWIKIKIKYHYISIIMAKIK